jgi:hypothetical protein
MPLQLLRVGLLRSPDFGGTLRPELPDYPVKSSTASLLQTHVTLVHTLTGVTLAPAVSGSLSLLSGTGQVRLATGSRSCCGKRRLACWPSSALEVARASKGRP